MLVGVCSVGGVGRVCSVGGVGRVCSVGGVGRCLFSRRCGSVFVQ